jgi:hypothetical protein
MATEVDLYTRTVQFPPLNEKEAAQIQKLVSTMNEFMEVEIECREETIKVLKVEFPGDRQDVLTILNKLILGKNKKGKK